MVKLQGIVEVDETYVGGRERNKRKKTNAGRGTVGKTPVMGIRERGGKVAAAPIEGTDASTLMEFIKSHVAPGSTVYTDGASAYERHPSLPLQARQREAWTQGMGTRDRSTPIPLSRSGQCFKRAIYGTWHHVSVKHLARYVNEVSFPAQ